jgi:H/ACA ribonucleoprotein complex subunit 2
MAKDKSEKVKKEKKEKRSETDGIKKSKKGKKSKLNGDNVAEALDTLAQAEALVIETKAVVVKESNGELAVKPVGALVPFANPLADDKVAKKVLKSVKKGTAAQSAPEMERAVEIYADLCYVQLRRTRPSSAV